MPKRKKRNDHSKPGLYLKYSALSMCGHLFLLISPNSLTIITINLFLSGLILQKPFITLFFWNCPPVLPKTPLRAASISSVCSSYSRNSWKKQLHHTRCTVHLWNFSWHCRRWKIRFMRIVYRETMMPNISFATVQQEFKVKVGFFFFPFPVQ